MFYKDVDPGTCCTWRNPVQQEFFFLATDTFAPVDLQKTHYFFIILLYLHC